jgi:hypothetical protein
MKTIAERAAGIFTWGRIAFLVIIGMAGFATFVAGEVSGARTLEPRVTALEIRAEKVDARMSIHAEHLAEIRGYVRAIAERVGAKP